MKGVPERNRHAVARRFPDALTSKVRAVTRKLLRGDLKVMGLLRRPATVALLNRLLSVV